MKNFFYENGYNFSGCLRKINENDKYSFYVEDKRIILVKNKINPDDLTNIKLKDKNNEKIIYEIFVKLTKNNKLFGNGIVIDRKRRELIIIT